MKIYLLFLYLTSIAAHLRSESFPFLHFPKSTHIHLSIYCKTIPAGTPSPPASPFLSSSGPRRHAAPCSVAAARRPTAIFYNSSSLRSKPSSYSLKQLTSRRSNLYFRHLNYRARAPKMAAPLQVSASSTIGASDERLETSSSGLTGSHDLLIVGPGVLGRLVAQKWLEEHPGCEVHGQTFTVDHHDELIQLGIQPSLKGGDGARRFPYVIFCAPPSRSLDYPGDVRLAASSWNGQGSFLFTSSSAPYDRNDNGPCDEDSAVVPIGRSPRTDVLLKSENVVIEFGGCVLRLAGLYKADRGAHSYWLEKGTADIRPDHILNLIHYEDAASLSVAILKKKLRGRIFLGCDNHPVSRQEIMDLMMKSGKFSKKFEGFTGTKDPLGKRLNNTKTRAEIGWEPKYPSFKQFLETI